ncbi:MAG TPA: NAD-dependent epimerase/dehydratase family protein [Cyclobacteriaceae bacterium]|nr:NAD-dependent epimerase/dehydratase family protein [Cyclobacteriaceae bacterium]
MVVVTGANGLLGSYVIRKLLETGEPCRALKREGSDTSLLSDLEDQIEWQNIDIRDTEAVYDVLADASQVIHCAALVSFNPSDKRKLYETNVVGTRNVVNSCLENGVKRLVHVSSVGALGRQKHARALDESAKWVPGPTNTAYGESKYLAELEVMRGCQEGLDAVIVNPSVILGPGLPERSSAQILQYVWKGRRFYPEGRMNYISVQDAAEIIYRLLREGARGERFIASAGTISYKEVFEKIAQHLSRRSPHIKLNTSLLPILVWLDKLRSAVLGRPPGLTRDLLTGIRSPVSFQNDKVKKALNFEFQSIDETIQWCCETYVRQLGGKK